MKNNYLTKSVVIKLCTVLLAGISLFIIHSCKKDLKTQQEAPLADADIANAKEWYTNAYPLNIAAASNTKLAMQSVNSHRDFSQFMNPDWQHGKKYTRLNREVIELPLDPASKALFALKNIENNKLYADKKNSKSSFLLLKNGQGYDAYIMTIIADSDYLKGDYSKLARNTYSKRDTGFSGLVLYFTPKGKFISGHGYKNGHLIAPAKSTNAQQVQNTGKLKTNTAEAVICGDWYLNTYINEVLISSEYLYTECWYGSGSGSGGDGGGGGGGSTGAPPQCAAGTIINAFGGRQVNVYTPEQQPVDGGFPDPAATQCYTPVDIINDVKNPCLKKQVDFAISNNVKYTINQSMNSIFNDNTNFNLNFNDDLNNLIDLGDDGETRPTYIDKSTQSGTNRTLINAMNLEITLNPSQIGNSSKEYIAATIIHEAFHAYLKSSQTIVNDHLDMARNYISTMTADLLIMFPNLSPEDAKALSWGGLELDAGSLYSTLSDVEKIAIQNANQSYKSGSKGQLCN
ncbi:hypothetical protein [Mucilaginibacter sp.]|uniref:hypothetical protein n=1 Tax=Mucilaginibacter sp. TaxID=1882438 RepID=UPI00261C7BFC|nr:hypothetical protein [Mucilaginibacter sp.]MDB4924730.1 hypothetical protein [Mucilaginibacter sp.]